MPRFFVDSPLLTGDSLQLPEGVVRHLHVSRVQAGSALVLFNGQGPSRHATLVELGKKHAVAQIGEPTVANGAAPPYRVTLVQGIASNEKMDWLIEKAVELGVHRIVPITADRSVVRLAGERRARRAAHWTALSRAACEQCGRDDVPEILAACDFEDWFDHEEKASKEALSKEATKLRLLLSPRGTLRFDALPETPPTAGVTLMIGPEGGWSAREEDALLAAGYAPMSLGSRVLRTETAGMAVLAAMAARWGGW